MSALEAPEAEDPRPSLLMVVPHFVPERTVAGLRVSYWAQYLVERGCEVTVVIPKRTGALPEPDEGLEWLDEVELLQLPRPSPQQFSATPAGQHPNVRRVRRRAVSLLGTPFVPDRQIRYWESTVDGMRSLAERIAPTAVLTTSPPHSLHLIGRDLKQTMGLAWIADLRDPYLDDSRFGPKGLVGAMVRSQHEAYERSIYDEADLVVHAIEGHFTRARQKFPEHAQRMRYLPNGFPDEMLALAGPPPRHRTDTLRLVTAGNTGGRQLAAVADALEGFGTGEPSIELRICGAPNADPATTGSRQPPGVLYLGQLDHHHALEEIMGADILLAALSVERSKVGGCSSKLYEYMATGRPIVVINPTREDEHLLSTNYDWFTILREPSAGEIEDALREAMVHVVDAEPGLVDRPTVERVRRVFRRSNGAEELIEELEDLALPLDRRTR